MSSLGKSTDMKALPVVETISGFLVGSAVCTTESMTARRFSLVSCSEYSRATWSPTTTCKFCRMLVRSRHSMEVSQFCVPKNLGRGTSAR